jgi:hypothetical protein
LAYLFCLISCILYFIFISYLLSYIIFYIFISYILSRNLYLILYNLLSYFVVSYNISYLHLLARMARLAGARGLIVVNSEDTSFRMPLEDSGDPSRSLPAVMVPRSAGLSLRCRGGQPYLCAWILVYSMCDHYMLCMHEVGWLVGCIAYLYISCCITHFGHSLLNITALLAYLSPTLLYSLFYSSLHRLAVR